MMHQSLANIIDSFGGYQYAFDKEDKTRHLVQDLLIKVCRKFLPES